MVAALTVSAQTNSVHNWTLKSGAVFSGDYFSSGTTMVVIKSHGTNCLLKISELSTNDWLYFQDCKVAQERHQLEAKFQKDFTITYDKFREIYTIAQTNDELHVESPTNKYDLIFFFNLGCTTGDIKSKPATVDLYYSGKFLTWLLYPKTDFIILSDGQRKAFDDLKVSGGVISADDCLEQFDAEFTFDEFKQIAFSKSCEASFGIIKRVIFDYKSREPWRAFVSHFENLNADTKTDGVNPDTGLPK
jgi:hypothetical protein